MDRAKMDTYFEFFVKNVLENAPQQTIFLSRDRYGFSLVQSRQIKGSNLEFFLKLL